MAKKYKDLSHRIVNAIAPYFGNYQVSINFEIYCKGLETLFTQDEETLKEIAFQILDLNQDKKLSENDMFDLMKMTSAIKGGYYLNPDLHKNQKILPLNEHKFDLFLDVFSNDYIKIIKAIERKKDIKGITDDDNNFSPNQKDKSFGRVKNKMGAGKLSSNLSEASGDETTHSDKITPHNNKKENMTNPRDKRKIMN